MVRLQFIPQQNVTAATAVTSAASLVRLGTLAGKVVSPVTSDKVMFRSRSILTPDTRALALQTIHRFSQSLRHYAKQVPKQSKHGKQM